MRAAGGGSIVMVSSVAGLQGLSKAAGYTAVKGAIDALTRQIAVEFGSDDIRCNCVVIGFVPVGQLAGVVAAHPTLGKLWADATLTRPSSVDDVANAMLYLASDDSGSTTGILLPVDGGILVQSPLPNSEQVIGVLGGPPRD
jgi:NAD(P)-dependent dehydrogenase (short-subunit alcohol dehydrogenase family)